MQIWYLRSWENMLSQKQLKNESKENIWKNASVRKLGHPRLDSQSRWRLLRRCEGFASLHKVTQAKDISQPSHWKGKELRSKQRIKTATIVLVKNSTLEVILLSNLRCWEVALWIGPTALTRTMFLPTSGRFPNTCSEMTLFQTPWVVLATSWVKQSPHAYTTKDWTLHFWSWRIFS